MGDIRRIHSRDGTSLCQIRRLCSYACQGELEANTLRCTSRPWFVVCHLTAWSHACQTSSEFHLWYLKLKSIFAVEACLKASFAFSCFLIVRAKILPKRTICASHDTRTNSRLLHRSARLNLLPPTAAHTQFGDTVTRNRQPQAMESHQHYSRRTRYGQFSLKDYEPYLQHVQIRPESLDEVCSPLPRPSTAPSTDASFRHSTPK